MMAYLKEIFPHQEGRKHHIITKTKNNFDYPASVFLFPNSHFIFSLPLIFLTKQGQLWTM
jgi:hypothetical protein